MSSRHDPSQTPAAHPAPGDAASRTARTIESAALFDGSNVVVILHAGREYRLRRTRLDKLILTA